MQGGASDALLAPFDVAQATGDGVLAVNNVLLAGVHGGGGSQLTLTATSNLNLDTVGTGSVDIWVLASVAD